jgi:16S rRNA (cytidine1402-2'-O)-methyltransferase
MEAALYAIPTPLGGAPHDALSASVLQQIRSLRDFVVENPKTARAFLSAVGMPCALRELNLATLDEHTKDVQPLLGPLREGRALGLLSEAGCPAIADPGARLVELAHREGRRVVPLVGPSSIVLALMASGLEGQRFAFCGYLPRDKPAREARLRSLEKRSRQERETQIFIETPYRNEALMQSMLVACAPATLLCVASDLTLASESVVMRRVADWRNARPSLEGRPTVFLLYAA